MDHAYDRRDLIDRPPSETQREIIRLIARQYRASLQEVSRPAAGASRGGHDYEEAAVSSEFEKFVINVFRVIERQREERAGELIEKMLRETQAARTRGTAEATTRGDLP